MAKIVVIEDEFDIRDEVMTWLQFEGHEVYCAENGREGLETIFQEQPDLVLCDISMPEMDGFSVLFELRSDTEYVQLPFIFLTAVSDRESLRKGMNLGADDYITKPFKHEEVIHAVNTRLGKQHQIKSQIEQLGNLIEEERELRLLKSRMIGMFSHDFRNPLAVILSASNMLQSYSDRLTPEQKQRRYRSIDGSVHFLIQMLDEMLLVAEIENGELPCYPQATNLKNMIDKITGNFRLIDNEKHLINTTLALPELVMIDAKFLQHIISNLVSNALKYSPDGTEVSIDATVENNWIIVSVDDSGIGIPEDELNRIFEPFFRADNVEARKGTGLGLALVKQLLDACGGTIDVASNINVGSTFTVKVPLHVL